jgi:hypothetical protein
MPYNFPDRVAIATSSVATPLGLVSDVVAAPDTTDFSFPNAYQGDGQPYSDSSVVLYGEGVYFDGSSFDEDKRRVVTVALKAGQQAQRNVYSKAGVPAENFFLDSGPDNTSGYWDEHLHIIGFDFTTFYLNIQFANCHYTPLKVGPFETAPSTIAYSGRTIEGFSVIGSQLGAPESYQFQPKFRGPGATQSCIQPFRRKQTGGDIDGTEYSMIGVRGETDGTDSVEFVHLFNIGATHTDVEISMVAVHASAASPVVTALGQLTYDVLEDPILRETYLAIFTPVPLYTITGNPYEPPGATNVDLTPPQDDLYTPRLQNLNGVGNIDLTGFRWQGIPIGMMGWDPTNANKLYVVNPLWTAYTCYEVVENDEATCTAFASAFFSIIRNAAGEYIWFRGLAGGYEQFVAGPLAPGYAGCLGGPPPPPPFVPHDPSIQFTGQYRHHLEPSVLDVGLPPYIEP